MIHLHKEKQNLQWRCRSWVIFHLIVEKDTTIIEKEPVPGQTDHLKIRAREPGQIPGAHCGMHPEPVQN